jgi:hypothetical protein
MGVWMAYKMADLMIDMPNEIANDIEMIAPAPAPKRKLGKKSSVAVAPKEPIAPVELIAESTPRPDPVPEIEEMITIPLKEYNRLKALDVPRTVREKKDSRELSWKGIKGNYAVAFKRMGDDGAKYNTGDILYSLEMPKKGEKKREELSEKWVVMKVDTKGCPIVIKEADGTVAIPTKGGSFDRLNDDMVSYHYYLMEKV